MTYLFYYIPQALNKNWVNANNAYHFFVKSLNH